MAVLFKEVAPRFVDRPGGYTRVVRLAQPRLGDAGTRAILELVGVRDRVTQRAERPAFDDTTDNAETDETAADDAAEQTDDEQADVSTEAEESAAASGDEQAAGDQEEKKKEDQ